MTQNQESRSMMSYEESVAFNDGWKRGEAYGRREAYKDADDRAQAAIDIAVREASKLLAERDALRAQLDAMTTEWNRVSAAVHEDLADRIQVIVDRTQAPIQEIPGWLRSRAAEIRQRVEVE